MQTTAAVKTWEKTKLQNLVRHKSGGYYARLFLNGKEIWKSLKTKHFSVAEARLAVEQKDHRERRGREIDPSNAKMTFGQASVLHLKRLDEKVSIKSRTRQYWKETLEALLRSWPELEGMEVRKVTQEACRDWAARYAKVASASRYNNSLSLVRHVIDVAIGCGVMSANPATKLHRKPVHFKEPALPSLAQFEAFIKEMRSAHSRNSQNCADLVEGLAYVGGRITETTLIELRDLDFKSGEVLVKGDAVDGTKNGETRRVPMIPQAKALFERMMVTRTDEPKTAKLFRVRECQKSMDRAAKKVGMARITHHDLRHFFATVCIESGVDIPTVARWLGHKDGGALAMKIYGHLRREHSLAQAQKVSFAPAAAA